jgi:hypothetical protein
MKMSWPGPPFLRRGYSQKKISENVECEIMMVVMEEASESYRCAPSATVAPVATQPCMARPAPPQRVFHDSEGDQLMRWIAGGVRRERCPAVLQASVAVCRIVRA